MVLDYLYRLDYNATPTLEEDDIKAQTKLTNRSPISPLRAKINMYESLSSPINDTFAQAENTPEPDTQTAAEVLEEAEDPIIEPEPEPDHGSSRIKEDGSIDDENVDLDKTELSTHALVYALADKYGIGDLKDMAKTKFSALAKEEWPQSQVFAHAAGLVYETTPDQDKGLRDAVVETVTAHHRDMLEVEEVQNLLESEPKLMLEVLKNISRQLHELYVGVPSAGDDWSSGASKARRRNAWR